MSNKEDKMLAEYETTPIETAEGWLLIYHSG